MTDPDEDMPQIGSSPALRRSGSDSGYHSLVSTMPFSLSPKLQVFSDKTVPEELLLRFADIQLLFHEPLVKAITRRNGKRGDASWKLKYLGKLGEDESRARLHIIIQCEKNVARKVRKFFKQDDVKKELGQDFLSWVEGTSLERLIHHTDSVEPGSTMGLISVFSQNEQCKTLCGTAIELRYGQNTRSATFGGLIKVAKVPGVVLYGITAGHFLDELGCPTPPEYSPEGSELGNDTGSDTDPGSDSSGDCQNVASGGQYSRNSPNQSPQVIISAPAIEPDHSRQIGTIDRSSFTPSSRMSSRDWALIELSACDPLPNSLSTSMNLPGWDNTIDNMPLTGVADIRILLSRPKINAMVLTRRGVQLGALSWCNSSILVAPGRHFVDTLEFSPAAGSSLMFGDSGSWVVDPQNGLVYGHVVAIDVFGEAHVVPMNDILQDISKELQASHVSLPSASDIIAITSLTAIPNERPCPRTEPTASHSSNSLGRNDAINRVILASGPETTPVGHPSSGPTGSNKNIVPAEKVTSPSPTIYRDDGPWHRHYHEFREWVAKELDSHCGTRFSEDGPVDSPYVPLARLRDFWTIECIEAFLETREGHRKHTGLLLAEEIHAKFLRIFTTLVFISDMPDHPRIHYLDSFARLGLDDANLPIRNNDQLEDIFTGLQIVKTDKTRFYESQFLFKPYSLGETINGKLTRTMRETGLEDVGVLPMELVRVVKPIKSKATRVEVVLFRCHPSSGLVTRNDLVIAKIFPPEEISYAFANEHMTCTRVQSEYILACFGTFIQCRRPVILLEYADQGNLVQFFQQNNLPYTRDELMNLWRGLSRLFRGLAALHNAQPYNPGAVTHVHQDLQPSNIFVFSHTMDGTEGSQYRYRFKLGDSGSSSAKTSAKDRDHYYNRTPRVYGAPELVDFYPSLHNLDTVSSSDIWSMGCVLIEAAVWSVGGERGRKQFFADRTEETTNQHKAIPACESTFHNGKAVLETVRNRSFVLKSHLRVFDTITVPLLDWICTYLLEQEPAHRLNARQAGHFMRRLIDDVQSFPPAVFKDNAPPPTQEKPAAAGKTPWPSSPCYNDVSFGGGQGESPSPLSPESPMRQIPGLPPSPVNNLGRHTPGRRSWEHSSDSNFVGKKPHRRLPNRTSHSTWNLADRLSTLSLSRA